MTESDQNVSAKNDQNVSIEKNAVIPAPPQSHLVNNSRLYCSACDLITLCIIGIPEKLFEETYHTNFQWCESYNTLALT